MLCHFSRTSSRTPCRNTWISHLRAMSLAPWFGVYLLWGFTSLSLWSSSPCGCLPKTWQNKALTEAAELKQWSFFLWIASLAEPLAEAMHFSESQQREGIAGGVPPPRSCLCSLSPTTRDDLGWRTSDPICSVMRSDICYPSRCQLHLTAKHLLTHAQAAARMLPDLCIFTWRNQMHSG